MGRFELYNKHRSIGHSIVSFKVLHDFIKKNKEKNFEVLHIEEVDALRAPNACPAVLTPWYHSFWNIRKEYRDECIFGADEMGIDLSMHKDNFLTKRQKRITVTADAQFPHTTVMFSHSMGGQSFPPI